MKVKEPDLTEQIREIFGTTDAKELRRIAEDAACYRKKGNSANRSPVGRKNSFTDPQLANILALQKQGVKITEIAKKYHVSRQTIYSQIKRVHNFSEDPDVKMRMYFMNRDYLCTMIDIDFLHEKIYIKNYTDQIPLRAFGVVDNPSWAFAAFAHPIAISIAHSLLTAPSLSKISLLTPNNFAFDLLA